MDENDNDDNNNATIKITSYATCPISLTSKNTKPLRYYTKVMGKQKLDNTRARWHTFTSDRQVKNVDKITPLSVLSLSPARIPNPATLNKSCTGQVRARMCLAYAWRCAWGDWGVGDGRCMHGGPQQEVWPWRRELMVRTPPVASFNFAFLPHFRHAFHLPQHSLRCAK